MENVVFKNERYHLAIDKLLKHFSTSRSYLDGTIFPAIHRIRFKKLIYVTLIFHNLVVNNDKLKGN